MSAEAAACEEPNHAHFVAKFFLHGKMPGCIFDDVIVVDKLNPEGKSYDKVCRIKAHGERTDNIMLDVATNIYPMNEGDKFSMLLASTLNLDGTEDTGNAYYTQAATLADDYEYVMRGKLYNITEDASDTENVKVVIHASFGGLLVTLKLKGDLPKPKDGNDTFKLDQRLFLLMRKA